MSTDDVVAYGPCNDCGETTAFLIQDDPICPACEDSRLTAAKLFRDKLNEMRKSKSIPNYNGPRAAR